MSFWAVYFLVAAFCLLVGIGEAAWVYRHPELNDDGKQETYTLQQLLGGIALCFLPFGNWLVAFGLCVIFFGFIAPNITVFGPKT